MKVIIVGGVAGGASCAARLRRLDEKAEIIMVERGPYVSYANCGLPYHAGRRDSEGIEPPAREQAVVPRAIRDRRADELRERRSLRTRSSCGRPDARPDAHALSRPARLPPSLAQRRNEKRNGDRANDCPRRASEQITLHRVAGLCHPAGEHECEQQMPTQRVENDKPHRCAEHRAARLCRQPRRKDAAEEQGGLWIGQISEQAKA